MAPTFYHMPASPPCRAVSMLLRHLDIKINEHLVDFLAGEHLSEQYRKNVNPLHTVPAFTDGDFKLWDSHVIMTYLANKYAPDSDLYPRDPQKRARVDLMLHFDNADLDKAQRFYYSTVFSGAGPLSSAPEKETNFKKALAVLDSFLAQTKYVAGDSLTLADFAVLGTLTFAEGFEYDLSSYSNVVTWQTRLKSELPYYAEVNDEPAAGLKAFVDSFKAKAAANFAAKAAGQ